MGCWGEVDVLGGVKDGGRGENGVFRGVKNGSGGEIVGARTWLMGAMMRKVGGRAKSVC